MTDDERTRKQEEARKVGIIEGTIERRHEELNGGVLRPGKKDDLKELTELELQQLTEKVQGLESLQAVKNAINTAISGSRAAREAADKKRANDLDPRPASMDTIDEMR